GSEDGTARRGRGRSRHRDPGRPAAIPRRRGAFAADGGTDRGRPQPDQDAEEGGGVAVRPAHAPRGDGGPLRSWARRRGNVSPVSDRPVADGIAAIFAGGHTLRRPGGGPGDRERRDR